MVVNPFFMHGSSQEQNLMQSLVNEQLRMYGIDVHYIPRTFIREESIVREVTSSAFRNYFVIEAYLNNYDGYAGQGDIMSKFGIEVKDEVTFTLSRERYEDYIAPFLNSRSLYLANSIKEEGKLMTIQRPTAGDLIYFPYGRRLFEIKFVEHEENFYQLGKNYTYKLDCELFRYEDEILNTTIGDIDTSIQNKGFITTVELVPLSNRATVTPVLAQGYIKELEILNDGYDYTSAPTIFIDPPVIGDDPNVVSLLTLPTANVQSSALREVVVFDAGSGYIDNPNVQVVGGGGNGAFIEAGISTVGLGIRLFEVTGEGAGYPEDADIIVYDENNLEVASGKALTDGDKIVAAVVKNSGENLDPSRITAIVAAPAITGDGIFLYNEIVRGRESGVEARVRAWNAVTYVLDVTNIDPSEVEENIKFKPGEIIEGLSSGAKYSVKQYNVDAVRTYNAQNNEVEEESKNILIMPQFDPMDPFATWDD